ncbi:hypothetical protein [Thermocatellispora tengchongensis]
MVMSTAPLVSKPPNTSDMTRKNTTGEATARTRNSIDRVSSRSSV